MLNLAPTISWLCKNYFLFLHCSVPTILICSKQTDTEINARVLVALLSRLGVGWAVLKLILQKQLPKIFTLSVIESLWADEQQAAKQG